MEAESLFHQKSLFHSTYKTIYECEKTIFYGVCCCFESFLDHFLVFPAEFVKAVFYVIFVYLPKKILGLRREKKPNANTIDYKLFMVYYGIVYIFGLYVCLNSISVSDLYHTLRQQSFLKLHGFYTILEWADRAIGLLHCDSLMSLLARCAGSNSNCSDNNASNNEKTNNNDNLDNNIPDGDSKSKDEGPVLELKHQSTKKLDRNAKGTTLQLIIEISVAVFAIYLHVLSMLSQFCIVAVSLTSPSYNLYALLVGIKFIELKAGVFKKFDHMAIFQVTTADAVDRFSYLFLFFLAIVQSSSNIIWEPPGFLSFITNSVASVVECTGNFLYSKGVITDSYSQRLQSPKFINCVMLLIYEWMIETAVDFFKHAYLVRHNIGEPREMYREYKHVIVTDRNAFSGFIEREAIFLRRTGVSFTTMAVLVIILFSSKYESVVSLFIDKETLKWMNTYMINAILHLCKKSDIFMEFYTKNQSYLVEAIKSTIPIALMVVVMMILKLLLKFIITLQEIFYNKKKYMNSPYKTVWKYTLPKNSSNKASKPAKQ